MFLRDKALGEQAEKQVKEIIGRVCEVLENKDRENFLFFDLACKFNNKKFKIEVKNDDYARKSGNWAIEYFNTKSNKPSGIMATKANLWAHCTSEGVFITPTKHLKEFCNNRKPLRICESIGDGNASILLYEKEDIKEIFHHINDLPQEELKQLLITLLKV